MKTLRDIVILDTYFNINHLVTKSCILQAYNELELEEPIFGGYDDFNKGADFCGIDRLKDFVRGVHPNQRVVFYAINDKNILDLLSFKENNHLDNFIIIHTTSIVQKNQYSKVEQYKFLESKSDEYKKYLPIVMYLDHTYMIKEDINSGSRGCIYIKPGQNMMVLRYIDNAVKVWNFDAYAINGRIQYTALGTMENVHYRSGTKYIPLSDTEYNPEVKQFCINIIKDMKVTGICNVDILEDTDGNIWFMENNLRPGVFTSDYLREGVIEYVKNFVKII